MFLGDIIDRGPKSLETLETVCQLVTNHPRHIKWLRGKNEGPPYHSQQSLTIYTQTINRYHVDKEALLHLLSLFIRVTVVLLIPSYAFLVHGHIPHKTIDLESIKNTDEYAQVIMELLWNDPATTCETYPSFRREGCYYVGTDQVDRFLAYHGLRWVIRGHEKPDHGYITQGQTFILHTTGDQITYLKLPPYPNKDPTNHIIQI